MSVRTLFLICNAHLDPVWLWTWQEGLAETLSTFRTAARLCEEFEEFVFCHNEALLYQWVECYQPDLFRRIQGLVGQGRWHIMGGWYLQPDCNLPGGESFVRQILKGKRYFEEKFGVEPRTAVNFDPFGHTRGLVQILKRAGYDSYLFCRPDPQGFDLPGEDFIWEGYDGSRILAHRAPEHYNSEQGKAACKVRKWMEGNPERETGILLWGIGDHGGGPSRQDLVDLRELMGSERSVRIRHAVPETYFAALNARRDRLPVYARDLNPWAVGCYTTMTRIKERHRRLENQYLTAEKTVSHAWLSGVMAYPTEELASALEDLLFCQFHDILPGSSILEVEAQALQRMDHGLEILDRVKSRAFFGLLAGQAPAAEGEFPVFVYNPHPFRVHETVTCEFQPLEPNRDRSVLWLPELKDESGAAIPCQLERESSNISVDQRKKIAFEAKLEPWQMKRLSVRLKESAPLPNSVRPLEAPLDLRLDEGRVVIDPASGLLERFEVSGEVLLTAGALGLLVVEDNPDPWGMKVRAFRDVVGRFDLMTPSQAASFSGSRLDKAAPVRIVEDGPVRTRVEALFRSGGSAACVHYLVPKQGRTFEMFIRVFWNEKDRMLKLSVPTPFGNGTCRGQVAFGVENFDRRGEELLAQKWAAVLSEDRRSVLTVSNIQTYGFDFQDGELRFSLLRSAAYAAHPVADDIPLVPDDRFIPRIDQGERLFRFRFSGGEASERMEHIDREALIFNEPPFVLCCHPLGGGEKPAPAVLLDNEVVQLTALKRSERGDRLVLRLFEPTGESRSCRLRVPAVETKAELSFGPFEVKTVAVDLDSGRVEETDLLERPSTRVEGAGSFKKASPRIKRR
jgi:alpha-mannosidase